MSRVIGILLIVGGLGLVVWSYKDNIAAYYDYLTSDPAREIANPDTRMERPNILVITMDTTRWDHIGAYGGDVETPALDALADRGVRFEYAFTAAPVTLPSHSSMFTGRYPYRHGVRNNGQFRLPAEETALAEVLSEAGYETAAFVSAAVLESRYGLSQGFDLYDDDLRERIDTPEFVVPTRRAEVTVDRALEWLGSRDADRPFFAWVHLYDPHATYDPPQPFRSRYQGRPYEGEIAYMDSQIGRLLDWLNAEGAEDDTVVFALADHGEGLGQHGEGTHGLLIYDSTMRIPFVAAGPGLRMGMVAQRLVSTVDLYPTVLELADLEARGEINGHSLLGQPRTGVLQEVSRETIDEEGIYMEALLGYYEHGWAASRALRDSRYKWIHTPIPELFDTVLDPGELLNLDDVQTGRQSDGQRLLQELADDDMEREGAALEFDAEALERLQGLGYVFVADVPDYEERMDPKEALQYYNLIAVARNLVRDERWIEAVPMLEEVNAALPGDQSAAQLLVSAYLREDRIDEAREVAVGLMDSVSTAVRPGALLILARIEQQARRPGAALQLLEEGLQSGPYEVPVLSQLINLHLAQNRPELAGQFLDRLQESYPDEPIAWILRARVQAREGATEDALASLLKAYELDPKAAHVNLQLGQYYLEMRKLPPAKRHLETALKSDPASLEAHIAMGSVHYLQRDFETAKGHFRQAVRINPDALVAREKLALVDLAESRWQDAIERLRDLERKGLRTPGLYNNLAFALARVGQQQEALALWRRVIEMDPDFAEAHHNLGLTAMYAGDAAMAEEHLGRAAELSPDNVELQATWAHFLLKRGRNEDALGLLEELQTRFPDNVGVLVFLGRARMLAGQYHEAENILGRALILGPDDALTHLYLAELYDEGLGEPRKAIAHYRAAAGARGIDEEERQAARRRLAALEEEYLFAPVPEG